MGESYCGGVSSPYILKGVKMKKKKHNPKGYPFAGLFAGIDHADLYIDKLKKVAKEQHRSVSAQARLFIIEALQTYKLKD